MASSPKEGQITIFNATHKFSLSAKRGCPALGAPRILIELAHYFSLNDSSHQLRAGTRPDAGVAQSYRTTKPQAISLVRRNVFLMCIACHPLFWPSDALPKRIALTPLRVRRVFSALL